MPTPQQRSIAAKRPTSGPPSAVQAAMVGPDAHKRTTFSSFINSFSFLHHSHSPSSSSLSYLGVLLLSLLLFSLVAGLVLFLVNYHVDYHPLSPTPIPELLFHALPPSTLLPANVSHPHDPKCFTQGLEWHGSVLYESCGMYGASNVRIVDALTGAVLRKTSLDRRYFAEGLTVWGSEVFVLTWKEHEVLVFSLDLALLRTVPMPYEGWGLTHSATHLIMSNGTSHLTFLDPVTLQPTHTLSVTALTMVTPPPSPAPSPPGRPPPKIPRLINHTAVPTRVPVEMLNELEYVDGVVYANVWMRNDVVVIGEGGRVVRALNAAELWKDAGGDRHNRVLNGLAWKASEQRMMITGKYWPRSYRVELT